MFYENQTWAHLIFCNSNLVFNLIFKSESETKSQIVLPTLNHCISEFHFNCIRPMSISSHSGYTYIACPCYSVLLCRSYADCSTNKSPFSQLVLYGILVALIFDFYVEANKKFVKRERFRERQCLIKAFETLDKDETGYLDYAQCSG